VRLPKETPNKRFSGRRVAASRLHAAEHLALADVSGHGTLYNPWPPRTESNLETL